MIDTERYDVYLFTNVTNNPCVEGLREEIHLYDLNELKLRKAFFKSLQEKRFFSAFGMLVDYILARISRSTCMKVFWACRSLRLSDEVFDCVIAYKPVYISVIEALFHIKASKRAVWIHGAILGGDNPNRNYLKWLGSFDKAFCVSPAMVDYFEKICPVMKGRTEIFYNMLDTGTILEKAGNNEKIDGSLVLTTVGRLSHEKGQDMIPQTVRYLLDAGYQVKWYVVGDGPLRKTVQEKCKQYDVVEEVVLTGTLSNPYPYMKGCNIYVQTSYEEGWGLTVQEAKILHKPIVTTDLPAMREQIVHMKNGIITEGISPEALFEGIKTLLDNPALCAQFTEELKKESHDNTQELEKLYAFIES